MKNSQVSIFFNQDKERKRRRKATKDFTFIVEFLKPLVDNATQNNFIRIKKSKGGERLLKKIFLPSSLNSEA